MNEDPEARTRDGARAGEMPPTEITPFTKHPRRECPFCGSAGPLTKEDAWPRWLNKALPPAPGPGVALDIALQGNEVVRSSHRTVTGYSTARVKGFCKSCNNGWMSRLERQSAPVLLPLIRGERSVLNEIEQEILVAWVTKTALVFDQRARGRKPLVSPEITEGFGATREAIPGSRVLLARYSGTRWTLNHAVAGLPAVYRDGTEKTIVAIITLCVGALAMQLVCPTESSETVSTSLLVRDDREFAVQIHPPAASSVEWPPRVPLNSADWFALGLTQEATVDIKGLLDRVGPKPVTTARRDRTD